MWSSLVVPCVAFLDMEFAVASSRVRLLQPSSMLIWMSGQSLRACGHVSFARSHMVLASPEEHEINMCSMLSSSSQPVHCWRCLSSGSATRDQKAPIFCVLCIALYKNCRTRGRSDRFHMPCHIVPSVSRAPLYCAIAVLVVWMFASEEGQGRSGCDSLMPR
jgi:hypothetical protein